MEVLKQLSSCARLCRATGARTGLHFCDESPAVAFHHQVRPCRAALWTVINPQGPMPGDLTLHYLVPSPVKQDLCPAFSGASDPLALLVAAADTRASSRHPQHEQKDDSNRRKEGPYGKGDVHEYSLVHRSAKNCPGLNTTAGHSHSRSRVRRQRSSRPARPGQSWRSLHRRLQ